MKKRKSLTAKQRVLKKFPNAYCWKRDGRGYLVSDGAQVIGASFSGNAMAAWKDVETRMRYMRKPNG